MAIEKLKQLLFSIMFGLTSNFISLSFFIKSFALVVNSPINSLEVNTYGRARAHTRADNKIVDLKRILNLGSFIVQVHTLGRLPPSQEEIHTLYFIINLRQGTRRCNQIFVQILQHAAHLV